MPFRLRRRKMEGVSGPHACHCSPAKRQDTRNLNELEPGDAATVCCLNGRGRVVRRLAEMGFIPGTPVEVLRCAPLTDPVEYRIRGYLVSLRRDEAALVRVKVVHSAALEPISPDAAAAATVALP